MVYGVALFSPEDSAQAQETERERLVLLSQIQDAETHSSHRQRPWIASLKDRYNNIVQTQIDSLRGPLPDPINHLPIEIWVVLLKELVYRENGTSVQDLLGLTLVSARWRACIMDVKDIWADISIGPGLSDSDLEARLYLGLYLSRNHPLTLHIDHPTRDWDKILSIIRPHTQRIRSITIRRPLMKSNEELDPEDPSLYTLLDTLGHLPNLEELRLDGMYRMFPREWVVLRNMPRLKSILGESLPFHAVMDNDLRYLQELNTNSTVNRWFMVMARFPHLTHLWLDDADDVAEYGWSIDTRKEDSLRYELDQPLPPPLEKLDLLHYQKHHDHRIADLIRLCPNITRLTVSVSWKLLSQLLSVIGGLRNLMELSLYIKYITPKMNKFDLVTEDAPQNLRLFSISFSTYEVRSMPEDESPSQAEKTAKLLHIFKGSSHLEELILHACHDHTFPFSLVPTLSGLRTLHLDLTSLTAKETPRILSRSLENLLLFLPSELMPLAVSQLDCPNLVAIQFFEDLSSKIGVPSSVTFDSSAYQNLFSITWGFRELRWEVTSLQSLKLITFTAASAKISNEFLLHLILYPKHCPTLEQIEFQAYPEWDLLFLMLERRNFLQDRDVTSIRTIGLPTTIGLILREPLLELLRGRYAKRLSNFEISMAGLAEIYFDRNIPGCQLCSLSMHACKEPVYFRGMSDSTFRDPVTNPLSCEEVRAVLADPPLPTAVLEWLCHKKPKLDTWTKLAGTAYDWSRESVCDKHELNINYIFSGYVFSNPTRYRSVTRSILRYVEELEDS
ncbi:hypothetical protein PIIN_04003 [Serendipita indica DSM 11827]|uniref:F-box domain-containing protein n=1 Tax=Serendipita indica (strain DSM 11827) TaxID=1109443 RepID=G4TFI2_SERID|nr:hypothetical protein PIIN_04003 [Serendipita indica DSM 11827]